MATPDAILVMRKRASIEPPEWNARTKHDVDGIAESIRVNGFRDPIEVWATQDGKRLPEPHLIVAGEGRFRAAEQMGLDDVPVVEFDFDNLDACKRYSIANNRHTDKSEWELDRLVEGLSALPDLDGTGFTLVELEELAFYPDGDNALLTDGDDVPDTPDDPITVRGDVWICGEHRVMCGDSTDADTVAGLLPADVSLCFTSPPYSDQRVYGGDVNLAPEHLAGVIPAASPFCNLFCVNLGIARRDHEVVTYWDAYIDAAKDAGWKLLSWNVWDRTFAGSISQATAMFAIEHEFIFVFGSPREINRTVPNAHAGRVKHAAPNTRQADGSISSAKEIVLGTHRQLRSVYRGLYQSGAGNPHPAMFPAALPEAYIDAATNPGQSVYDPFLGSGTTMIAAEKLGRKCFGMDIEPKYVDVAVRRWMNATGQVATRESDGMPFPEETQA